MTRDPGLKQSWLSTFTRLSALFLLVGIGLGLLASVDFDIGRALELAHATHPWMFLLAMILLPLAGFPIAAFYLFAGTAYPWWLAFSLCSTALLLNMSIAYPIGKYLLAEPISRILKKYARDLPSLTPENQFRITFLVRSIPGIPYVIQNYMLPLIGVRFPQYLLISWSIQSLFAAGMTAVPRFVESKGWIPLGILVLLMVLLSFLRRVYIPSKKRLGPGFPESRA